MVSSPLLGIANSFNNDEEWKSEKISARASVMASISQVRSQEL